MLIENENNRIAVIITINNRYKETKKCLTYLNEQIQFYNKFRLDVYLSDSSESKFILEMDKKNFNFKYIKISSDKYWNRGMLDSWEIASKTYDYDFYLWLNNDTYLYNNGLKIFFDDYKKIDPKSILVGITQHNKELTYGGRKKLGGSIIKPNGTAQEIKIINGNCVLIPKSTFKRLGFLDKKFSHSLGDIDYGLRAAKNYIPLYCTGEVIGSCKKNDFIWYDSESFYKRYKNLKSPKGVPIYEYFYFNKKHFGFLRGLRFLLGTFVALIFPNLYGSLK